VKFSSQKIHPFRNKPGSSEFILPRVRSEPCPAKIFMGGQRKTPQEFVMEVGGRAVLALFADDIEHARTFCSQDWFWDELATTRSGGRPIWDSTSELKIRHAQPCEAAELQIALGLERFCKEYDGYVFAFLVPVDVDLQ
jgi:hypothetical protein